NARSPSRRWLRAARLSCANAWPPTHRRSAASATIDIRLRAMSARSAGLGYISQVPDVPGAGRGGELRSAEARCLALLEQFIAVQDAALPAAMDATLQDLAEFAGADEAHIFELSEDDRS